MLWGKGKVIYIKKYKKKKRREKRIKWIRRNKSDISIISIFCGGIILIIMANIFF